MKENEFYLKQLDGRVKSLIAENVALKDRLETMKSCADDLWSQLKNLEWTPADVNRYGYDVKPKENIDDQT